MRPSPPRVPRMVWTVNPLLTRPRMLATPKFHRNKPPCRVATPECILVTELLQSSSNRWPTNSTCNSSNKASEVSTQCLRKLECHISNNHPGSCHTGPSRKEESDRHDSDNTRNEIESLVLDTRTHAILIHPKKRKKSAMCRRNATLGHDQGVGGLLSLFIITIRCLRR